MAAAAAEAGNQEGAKASVASMASTRIRRFKQAMLGGAGRGKPRGDELGGARAHADAHTVDATSKVDSENEKLHLEISELRDALKRSQEDMNARLQSMERASTAAMEKAVREAAKAAAEREAEKAAENLLQVAASAELEAKAREAVTRAVENSVLHQMHRGTTALDDLVRQVYSLSQTTGKMQHTLLLDDLRNLLTAWSMSAGKPEQAGLAASIKSRYVRTASLIVSDMSGFTKVTKEEGICHFLMLIKRMQSICMPLMLAFSGSLVKTEADNLFVVFPSPLQALCAAMHCQAATRLYNRGKRANDCIHLSISVTHGSMFLIPGIDVFGGIVPVGFELGEEVAGRGETLLTKAVYDFVERVPRLKGILLEEAGDFNDGDHTIPLWRAVLLQEENFSLAPRCTEFSAPVVHSQVNSLEPTEFILLMERRMRPGATKQEVEIIDSTLASTFVETCAVLLVVLHAPHDAHNAAIDDADLALLYSVLTLKDAAANYVRCHLGQVVESMQSGTAPVVFALMPSAASAFNAVVEIAVAFGTGKFGICSPSFSISTGEVLNLGQCNAFGDPVNVAFKLAEDIAEPHEFLISTEAMDELDRDRDINGAPHDGWPFVRTNTLISQVDIEYFKLSWASEEVKSLLASDELSLAKSTKFDLRIRRASPESSQAVMNLPLGVVRFIKKVQQQQQQRQSVDLSSSLSTQSLLV